MNARHESISLVMVRFCRHAPSRVARLERDWFGMMVFFFSEVGPFFFVAFHNVVEGGGVYWLWSVLVTWYSRFFRCTKLVGSEAGWSLNCLFVFDVIMWFRPGGDLAYSKVIVPTLPSTYSKFMVWLISCSSSPRVHLTSANSGPSTDICYTLQQCYIDTVVTHSTHSSHSNVYLLYNTSIVL